MVIHWGPILQRCVELDIGETADAVHIRIRNSGPPIPPETLATLFERFARGKQAGEGHGLGLPIAQALIRAHGGRIAAHSADGMNEFSVSLPKA